MPTDEILLRVPAQLKEVVPALSGLVELIQEQIARTGGGKSIEYSKVEQTIALGVGEVERLAHGVILKSLNSEAKEIRYKGVNWRLAATRVAKEINTRTGAVSVERSLYRKAGDRNGPTIDPVSIRAGLVEDAWLPGVAKEMAFELQRGTSREAAQAASVHQILPYCRASFERIGHAVGELYLEGQATIEDVLMEQFEVPEAAVGISVSIDRAAVPMEEPAPAPETPPKRGEKVAKVTRAYRMAYCGSLSFFDREGEMVHTIRRALMPGNDPVSGICNLMNSDLRIALNRSPDLTLHKIGDGAPEVWNLLDEVCKNLGRPCDHEIIDFMHVVEKVGTAARVVYGESEGSKRTGDWASMLKKEPKGIETIHDEIMLSGHTAVNEGEGPVHDALTYIQRNSERMSYADAINEGVPIGSGVVEATVKSLIEGRMKKPGARWKIRGGDHVLQMRALAQSDRWSDAIDLALTPLRGSIRIVQN
jgi:hypothetical protein